MSDFPFPIANVGRRKRLFTPYNGDAGFNNDDSGDTYVMDNEVGSQGTPAYQFPDSDNNAEADYEANIAAMPNKADFKPSFGRNLIGGLTAGLAGLAGYHPKDAIGAGTTVIEEKYDDALNEWNKKNAQLKALSDISYKNMNARNRSAMIRNKFNDDAKELEFKKDQVEAQNQRAAQSRESQERIAAGREAGLASFRQGELANRQDQTKAFRERTDMMAKRPSRGSQVSKTVSPASQQKAHDEAVKEILIEQPDFEQYFDVDPRTNRFLGLKRDKNGQVAKLAPQAGGKNFLGQERPGTTSLQPLTEADKIALRNFQVKLIEKIKKKLSLNMGNVNEMQPDDFDFQDQGPDDLGGQEAIEDFPEQRQ